MKSVCCIMLANGRREMVERAVMSFHDQEYQRKRLLIYNSGPEEDWEDALTLGEDAVVHGVAAPIGIMRNRANDAALDIWPDVDVIAHWDSDDWSHPRRLSEQMTLLEHTGADIVGYRECLFWDTTRAWIVVEPAVCVGDGIHATVQKIGQAWTYRAAHPKHPIGSSVIYPRATWERKPFPNKNTAEDTLWLMHGRFKVHAVPSTWSWQGLPSHDPRMICAIHGANTCSAVTEGVPEWKRSPEFDGYCRAKMGGR